jgi:Fe-S oxidoreductase
MHIVEGIKEHLLAVGPLLAEGKEAPQDKPLINGAISEEAVWDCVTCAACMQECPVMVEHIHPIIDMRRYLVMELSRMPETATNALRSLEARGHPWRGTAFSRTDWAQGLDVKTMAENPDAEVLLWVGCTAALEERSQGVARAIVKVLKAAGVDFAILGEEEMCTGDPARRLGNEYLFQILAQQNIETLKRYNVKKIVTICPHCFNTLANEYPQFGGDFEVTHYTQFVSQLIQQGRLKPTRRVEAVIAYHDSCYLGRHNEIYEEPRRIASAIPGVRLVEMERSRRRSFCCGAGGGHMFLEEAPRGVRINHMRTDQFLKTGAGTACTSCPFCLQMFTEGLQAKGVAEQKQARDLLEILAESLEEG